MSSSVPRRAVRAALAATVAVSRRPSVRRPPARSTRSAGRPSSSATGAPVEPLAEAAQRARRAVPEAACEPRGAGHYGAVGIPAQRDGSGADGVLVEVHFDPRIALSDGAQSLYPEQFAQMMKELAPFVAAAGKKM